MGCIKEEFCRNCGLELFADRLRYCDEQCRIEKRKMDNDKRAIKNALRQAKLTMIWDNSSESAYNSAVRMMRK